MSVFAAWVPQINVVFAVWALQNFMYPANLLILPWFHEAVKVSKIQKYQFVVYERTGQWDRIIVILIHVILFVHEFLH
jgi:hypothetical protein